MKRHEDNLNIFAFFLIMGFITCAILFVALIDAGLTSLLSVLSGVAVIW